MLCYDFLHGIRILTLVPEVLTRARVHAVFKLFLYGTNAVTNAMLFIVYLQARVVNSSYEKITDAPWFVKASSRHVCSLLV